MIDTTTKILGNERVAQDFFRLALEAPGITREAKAGQFVMVRCSEGTDPLLRRPFSFHRIGETGFELLYKVVGKGTEILSKRKKGEILSVLGPLGKGFSMADNIQQAILAAGGTGVAPLLALAKQLSARSLQLSVFIGAGTKGHILCEEDFKKLGANVQVATEDGSAGEKGLVTDLLRCHCEEAPKAPTKQSNDRLAESRGFGTSSGLCPRSLRSPLRGSLAMTGTIFACGPKPMLAEVARIAESKKIPCRVSLEKKMACGTGACLGCAVETKSGYKMACKDGPVFKAEDIIW